MKLNKTTLEHISKMPGMRKFLRSTYPSKTDSEQMFDKMIEYGVSSTDESGNKKTEQMLKNEIEKKEMKVNDIRQQHDNEARVVSEMLISGENDAEKLRDVLIQKAAKELGGKEAKRIARRITDRIKKNKTKNVYLEKIYER